MVTSNDSGRTTSIWMATEPVPDYPALTEDVGADVCVVGAGIAGLTTAYLLALEGKSVVVLDDGPIGGGETARTTAHLASALDDHFTRLEELFGKEGARLAAESHAAAIDRIEAIVHKEHIDCDFDRVDGYLFNPPHHPLLDLDAELAAARRAGLEVDLLDRAPLSSFDTGPCLRFTRQGQFHVLKYLAAVAGAFTRLGGRIYSGAHATDVRGGSEARVVIASGRAVRAGAGVVVATNSPVNDRVAMHTKQAPFRTYALGLRVPAGTVPRALYWDTLDPYHYVRTQPDVDGFDILIVGGEDHKTGQAHDVADRYDRLERWARERFPQILTVVYRWSGQVLEPVDSLAFLGRNPADDDNVFIATGDSGHGMTHGTIAGMLITDLILGRKSPWEALYDPARKPLSAPAVKEFAKENLNVAAQYADHVRGGEVGSVDEVAPGSGAILREGLTKVAVHRDQAGRVHRLSAICPHLGCVVRWNPAESTWDCPCHGSRFEATGRVVNGPADRDLERLDEA